MGSHQKESIHLSNADTWSWAVAVVPQSQLSRTCTWAWQLNAWSSSISLSALLSTLSVGLLIRKKDSIVILPHLCNDLNWATCQAPRGNNCIVQGGGGCHRAQTKKIRIGCNAEQRGVQNNLGCCLLEIKRPGIPEKGIRMNRRIHNGTKWGRSWVRIMSGKAVNNGGQVEHFLWPHVKKFGMGVGSWRHYDRKSAHNR